LTCRMMVLCSRYLSESKTIKLVRKYDFDSPTRTWQNGFMSTIFNFQVKHSLTIHEGSKFYSFDVTRLLKNTIPDILDTLTNSDHSDEESDTHAHATANEEIETLGIECTVTEPTKGDTRQFSDIFDAYTEVPFILLRFQHIHLSATGHGPESHRHESVKDTEHG
jgi:hypothetical protein